MMSKTTANEIREKDRKENESCSAVTGKKKIFILGIAYVIVRLCLGDIVVGDSK